MHHSNNIKSSFTITKQNNIHCPSCNLKAKTVPVSAINHFLKDELKKSISSLEEFSFCSTPTCKVVYFRNTYAIYQSDIKYSIGIKENATPATVCFCFNWTKEKIEEQVQNSGDSTAIIDIQNNMKEGSCNCEVNNPRGRCCMSDVKKAIRDIKMKYS